MNEFRTNYLSGAVYENVNYPTDETPVLMLYCHTSDWKFPSMIFTADSLEQFREGLVALGRVAHRSNIYLGIEFMCSSSVISLICRALEEGAEREDPVSGEKERVFVEFLSKMLT